MKITSQDVEYVANLARLKIHDDEKDKLIADIESIIEFADVLSEVDTENIEPTYHAIKAQNVLREDIVTNNYDRDELLSNAPSKQDGCFEVPKVVE
jgi:aspartyl-tRNA(Asn)/glutamyl-tRNA(Gln) amidotransferase subunit C